MEEPLIVREEATIATIIFNRLAAWNAINAEILEYSEQLDSCYESHAVTRQDTLLPLGMCARLRLTRDVAAGTLLTEAMVEIPRDSVLWCLRREQDALFGAEC